MNAPAPASTRIRLAVLWASLTFCYLYGDYFGLYRPGKLQGMLEGGGPVGPTSQASLLFVALLLMVPGLMVALSVLLPHAVARWLNVGLALFFAVFVAPTMPGAWWFYLAYGTVEIVLCLAIAWTAWHWRAD